MQQIQDLTLGLQAFYSDYAEINGHSSGARLCGSQLGAVWRWGSLSLFEVI